MEVTYELTKADLVDSVKAHRNRSVLSKWFPRTIATIAFVAAGVGLLQMASDKTNQTFSNFAPIFVLAALWAGIIWASPWLFAKRMFGPSLKGPRTIQVDAGGLHLQWSGGEERFRVEQFHPISGGQGPLSPLYVARVIHRRAKTRIWATTTLRISRHPGTKHPKALIPNNCTEGLNESALSSDDPQVYYEEPIE